MKNAQISSLIKIRPVGTELFLADGQMDGRTDMTKLTVAFRSFANAIKNFSSGVENSHRRFGGNSNCHLMNRTQSAGSSDT